MARDQLVVHGGPGEVRVVPPHAHELVVVAHLVRGVGDADDLTPEEERTDQLSLGGHHLHAPHLARQRGDREPIAVLHEGDGLALQLAYDGRLLTGLDGQFLHGLLSGSPVIPIPHLP